MTLPNNTYESLLDELIYLRKGEGFTSDKLRLSPTLLRVLGGSGQPYDDLRARFVSAINSLPDKRQAETLLAAYGMLPEYANHHQLIDRRRAYGGRVSLRPDALAKHENAAIAELAIQLLTARYTLSPLPFSPSVVPHNAALHEYVEIATLVKDRLWQETREHYRIISLVDEVGWLEISSDIPARVVLADSAATGSGTNSGKPNGHSTRQPYEATTDPSSGGLRHRFYFAEPVMRGQLAELSFIMTPDSKLADPDTLILVEEARAFHEPTLAARFIVTFNGQAPSIIWQYDHLAIYERPGKPTKQQMLSLNDDNMAQADFTDLYGGMYSGVAWGW